MAYTLASLTDAVESMLKDSSNQYWSTDEIEDAIRWALAEYSAVNPRRLDSSIDDAAGSREYSLTSVAGLLKVTRVWWPYDSADPAYPPNLAPWYMLDDDTLYLDSESEPDGTGQIRLFYTAGRTIDGLDGATETSVNDLDCELLIVGAAGRCVLTKSRESIDTINVSSEVAGDWESWAIARGKEFRAGLMRVAERERMAGDARISWG
jgi:hypothetical protein